MTEVEKLELKILYVEDDEVARDEITQILKRRFHPVLTAENGSLGLQLFREHAPELVITDVRMPVMDGLEMLEEIRKLDHEVQIIVTTAHNDATYLHHAIEVGVDNYVMKPLETERFLAAIQKCASIIRMKKEALRFQAEREKLLAELLEAMGKIKVLSGMIPICASCKNIRNDKGYWQRIEQYIKEHSEAVFSHGICPDCARKLYPELYKNGKEKR